MTPAQVQAKLREAMALHQGGDFEGAQRLYEAILKVHPRNADALHLLGVVAAQSGSHRRAADLIGRAIGINPSNAIFHYNRGAALQKLNQFAEAISSYDKTLALKPDFADAYNNRGNALQELKHFEEAIASYNRALALKPQNAEAHNNRGNALLSLKRLEDAIDSYAKALAVKRDYAAAHANMGLALQQLERFDEAVACYDKALALAPDQAEWHCDRGIAMQALKRFGEAIEGYDKALALNGRCVEAHNNRASALALLGRFDEAVTSYDRVLTLDPCNANALFNRGNALTALRRVNDALSSYDEALKLDPGNVETHFNRGLALQVLKRWDEAIASYERALAQSNERGTPQPEFLFGAYLHAKMQVCDWGTLSADVWKLEAAVRNGKRVTSPFAAITLLDDPALLHKAAKIWCDARRPATSAARTFPARNPQERLRIGYYSADFHDHATSQLIAEMLEEHDRHRFEIFGFSFGPDSNDQMRQRVEAASDRFIDVRTRSDRDIAQLSAELGIDIAVDLKGFTADSRFGIFAERCAPIQASYLGFPGTMGADFIDYIIADRILIPPEGRPDFSEKVVCLPPSYQPNDSERKISERIFTRGELGLPETGFVFCCFNNSYKISPSTFESWMRILKAADGSVLWLLEAVPTAARNLRREAEARGIDGGRLLFAPRMRLDGHLARQRLADLFLDTLPCCAHTTASDALWAGLPILTRSGKTFAGRVAASLLCALDLPELITGGSEEYEARAIDFAMKPEKLRDVRAKLAQSRATAPLFKGKAAAENIEAAYEAMYARLVAGLAPNVIQIEPRNPASAQTSDT